MIVFTVTNHPDQQFGTIINGQRVTIRLRYNPTTDRWSFDISLDDQPVVQGRRIVTGIDLLAPFDLGVGMIVAAVVTPGAEPGRAALPAGEVRLFSVSEGEMEAL